LGLKINGFKIAISAFEEFVDLLSECTIARTQQHLENRNYFMLLHGKCRERTS